jgi:hypothetical protein
LEAFAKGLREVGSAINDCELGTIAEDLATIAGYFSSGWGFVYLSFISLTCCRDVTEGIKIIVNGFNVSQVTYKVG